MTYFPFLRSTLKKFFSYKTDLLETNSLNFCLFEKFFYSWIINLLDHNSRLMRAFFFFSSLSISLHSFICTTFEGMSGEILIIVWKPCVSKRSQGNWSAGTPACHQMGFTDSPTLGLWGAQHSSLCYKGPNPTHEGSTLMTQPHKRPHFPTPSPGFRLQCMKLGEREWRSVVSDSLWPHGLYSPWKSPGQNTGVGSLSLL